MWVMDLIFYSGKYSVEIRVGNEGGGDHFESRSVQVLPGVNI